MKPIPNDILYLFESVLRKKAVPISSFVDYKKWLRYYLDFKSKYSLPDSKSEHVRLFIEKLKAKNQSPEQQKQAAHAISLFFESQQQNNSQANSQNPYFKDVHHPTVPQKSIVPQTEKTEVRVPVPQSLQETFVPSISGVSHYNDWSCLKKSLSPDWDIIILRFPID